MVKINDAPWYYEMAEFEDGDSVTIQYHGSSITQEITDVQHGGKDSVTLTLERRTMFEVGDKVWYRGPGRHDTLPVPAVITGYRRRGFFATDILTCRCEGALFDLQGRLYNFESRACHLCGEPPDAPGCPLCPACAEEQREQEQDAKLEADQRRRPR